MQFDEFGHTYTCENITRMKVIDILFYIFTLSSHYYLKPHKARTESINFLRNLAVLFDFAVLLDVP